MTRESEKTKIRMNVVVDRKHINSLKKADEVIDQIFDEHEAQLKAKDEEIKELGEIVQQYLIPSKNYDAIIRDKDEEIERLRTFLMQSNRESVLIGNKIGESKSRSIVAMLFWEWKKDKRIYEKANKYTKETAELYVNCSGLSFKKAYAILKDKQ